MRSRTSRRRSPPWPGPCSCCSRSAAARWRRRAAARTATSRSCSGGEHLPAQQQRDAARHAAPSTRPGRPTARSSRSPRSGGRRDRDVHDLGQLRLAAALAGSTTGSPSRSGRPTGRRSRTSTAPSATIRTSCIRWRSDSVTTSSRRPTRAGRRRRSQDRVLASGGSASITCTAGASGTTSPSRAVVAGDATRRGRRTARTIAFQCQRRRHITSVPSPAGRHGDTGDVRPRRQDCAELVAARRQRSSSRTAVRDLQRRPGLRRRLGRAVARRRRTDRCDAGLADGRAEPVAPPVIFGAARRRASCSRPTTAPGSGASPRSFTYQWSRCDSAGNGCATIGGATLDLRGRLRRHRPHASRRRHRGERGRLDRVRRRRIQTGVVTLAGTVNPPVNTAYPVITLPFGHTGAEHRRHPVRLQRHLDGLVPDDVHVPVEEVRLADGELLHDRRRRRAARSP